MKTYIIIIAMIPAMLFAAKHPEPTYLDQCLTTREYKSTLGFLRAKKEFAIKEKDARRIADIVSKDGCTGAAKRFSQIVLLLVRAQLDSKSAIETALKFVPATDLQTKAFKEIFKRFYVAEFMNLDILTSIKMALSLSVEFNNFGPKVLTDFNKLAKFCARTEKMELPKPTCAQLAGRVTRLGQNFKDSISDPFIKLYEYLISKDGANLPAFRAMKVAEDVIAHGPMAETNFKQAYKFALNKKGLALSNIKALEFGMKMAKRTIKLPAKEK